MAQNNAATEALAATGFAPPQTSLPTRGMPHAAARPTASGLNMQESKKALPVVKDLPAPMIYTREVDIYRGKVYPKGSSKPPEELRVWNARYSGHAPPYGTAFLMTVPKGFDFWTNVWGPNGRDFYDIIMRYVDVRLCLAWGYNETINPTRSETRQDLISRSQLPDVDMHLMIGFEQPVSLMESEVDLETPVNGDKIMKLWQALIEWKRQFLNGRSVSLIAYLQRLESEISTSQGLMPGVGKSLPDSLILARQHYTLERQKAEKAVQDIINRSGRWEAMAKRLKEWTLNREEGIILSFEEPIQIIESSVRLRVLPLYPDMDGPLVTWVSKARPRSEPFLVIS
ncbi:hypothetical protein NW752_003078 [Fusarium irregulare]|uniref:Uncharacterized protein n=1 Tax=Fusarium irregulare TaxID=2494466 RepID=A0A9W8Q0E3_9HYPO|nr:hypothetical protein NW766_000747 [Fusarium irregulare]KAJ4025605.1 hypothetical protein NW752_003078 [Fusarium irregulare]